MDTSFPTGSFDPSNLQSTIQWLLPAMGILSIAGLILYIYGALTLQAMAKKLNHPNTWLAWIPIANTVLIYQISNTAKWTIICYFIGLVLAIIPVIGVLLALGVTIIGVYWYWKICEKLNRPGWWSIFSIVFYPVFLAMLGIMAWSDSPKKSNPQV